MSEHLAEALGLVGNQPEMVKEIIYNDAFHNYAAILYDKSCGWFAFFAHQRKDGTFSRVHKALPTQVICHRWLNRKHRDNMHFAPIKAPVKGPIVRRRAMGV
jgi:hypothetical protein